MKVLILKPSSLGDIIHALPVARLLRLQHPGCEIHWWISKDLLPLLEGDPDIARLIPFNRRRWWSPTCKTGLWYTVNQARKERYDLVIDLQGLMRSAIFSWLARGTFTAGVLDKREGGSALYDLAVERPGAESHAVDWYLEVAKAVGLKTEVPFTWMAEKPDTMAEVRRKWKVEGARWVVLCPGARWDNKVWPLNSFVELSQKLLHEHRDVKIVVIGGREDMTRGRVLHTVDRERVLDLTGCTSLGEMVEWIRLADVTVTNDTGPMHVAAALSKPVVAFFGPTAPERTGPYGQIDQVLRANLPCMPCMQRRCHFEETMACLHRITPEQAAARTSGFLG
ncbi:MAG TPA: lipopolysaccharide heptosyltransferase II [Verrucomicrobiae bacterium]